MSPSLPLLLLSLWAGGASAGFGPSFSIQYADEATDIVVLDPKGTVVEALKGKYKKGDKLPSDVVGRVSGLPTCHGAECKSEPDTLTPAVVPDLPVVLFLKKWEANLEPAALRGGWIASAVWIDGPEAYAFQQVVNPGPTRYVPVGAWRDLKRQIVRASQPKRGK
jgi:hypothetical protein